MIKNIKNNLIGSGLVTFIIIVIIALGTIILAPIAHADEVSGYNVTYNSGTGSTNNVTFQPAPYINSINPDTVYTNSSSRTLTIYGNNFVRNSIVKLDGSPRATNYVNSTMLETQLNYNDTDTVGTHSIYVSNPGSGGDNSNITYLTIKQAPVITGSVKGVSTVATAKAKTTVTKKTSGKVLSSQTSNTSDNTNDYSALAANSLFGTNTFLPSGLMQWLLFAILILLIVIITRKIFVGDDEKNRPLKHA